MLNPSDGNLKIWHTNSLLSHRGRGVNIHPKIGGGGMLLSKQGINLSLCDDTLISSRRDNYNTLTKIYFPSPNALYPTVLNVYRKVILSHQIWCKRWLAWLYGALNWYPAWEHATWYYSPAELQERGYVLFPATAGWGYFGSKLIRVLLGQLWYIK